MRVVWFIGKLELVLNCNNYENLNPKSRTSQTRKTLPAMLSDENKRNKIFNFDNYEATTPFSIVTDYIKL